MGGEKGKSVNKGSSLEKTCRGKERGRRRERKEEREQLRERERDWERSRVRGNTGADKGGGIHFACEDPFFGGNGEDPRFLRRSGGRPVGSSQEAQGSMAGRGGCVGSRGCSAGDACGVQS